MDVLLDETTLHPCAPEPLRVAPAHRILALAETLKALDGLGLPRVLRSVRDAPDRDLGDGRGLRSWCSDRALERDARVLILSRLGKQPFIDGPDGLFCRREGAGVIEGRCDGIIVYGLGLAALSGREPVFGSVLRHLGALDQGARQWAKSSAYCPAGGVNWSVESETTLRHGRSGPLRDFPVPAGFAQERFSYHTKLGTGWRLYFRPERAAIGPLVLIGYLGPHLPTARFDG